MTLKSKEIGGVKEREQSIELLRILLMSLVVFGHLIGHGGFSTANLGDLSPSAYLYPLYFYHVDAFVFISGYFGIKLKWKKFAMLVIKMVIYSLLAIGLASLIMPDYKLSLSSILKNLYPISACDWWFMSQYLYLMLLAPILNYGMEALDKKQATVLVLVLYLSWFRCTSVLLLFIYVLGRYLRKYPCKMLEDNAGKVFISIVMFFFVLNYYLMSKGVYVQKLHDYMSPFAVIPAVAIFYLFKRMHITWKGIGVIASGVLAAYLITDHELPRKAFCSLCFETVEGNVIALLGIAIGVVVICSMIDLAVTRFLGLGACIISKR